MKRSNQYAFCALTFLSFWHGIAAGQVNVSGPTCVVPGTLYQYTISGTWDSTATMQACLTNGRLAKTSNGTNCTPSGSPFNKVLVIWNDSSANTGSISLTSSLGNSTINVTFAPPLQPGSIDSASAIQIVGYDSVPPSPITCNPDTGGSCAPVYKYQWQQSIDRVTWRNIPLANGRSLQISTPAKRSTFYRRRVTEIRSGSVGYSSEAAVFLNIHAVLPDSTLQIITDSANAISGISLLKSQEHRPWCTQAFGLVNLGEALPAPARTFFRKTNETSSHG